VLDDLKQRGVKFRSVTESIDTDTPTGRAMWMMIALLAELERSLIIERTREGIRVARANEVKFGRKPKLTRQQIAHAAWLIDEGQRREDVASLFQINLSFAKNASAGIALRCRAFVGVMQATEVRNLDDLSGTRDLPSMRTLLVES
jgi:DNA invertase Pin-like site-specific DNA recombinase